MAFVVDVKSVVNATTQGGPQGAPEGILSRVTPLSLDSVAIARGTMYAELWLANQAGTPFACLWRGYLKTTGAQVAGASSVPGVRVHPGQTLVAVVTQTNTGVPTRVGFNCEVEADATAGELHAEEFTVLEFGGSPVAVSNPLPVQQVVAGAPVSGVNPVPVQTTGTVPVAMGAPTRNNVQGDIVITSTGVKLTFTGGASGSQVRGVFCQLKGGGAQSATVRLAARYTSGGNVAELATVSGGQIQLANLALEIASGETVTIEVVTADAAGVTMRGSIFGVNY